MVQAQHNPQAVLARLASIPDVPTLPAIAMRAIEISNDDYATATTFGNFISQDQALSAKLLRLVNSAHYGLAGKVATVPRAVVVMGFAKVRSVIISSAAANIFSGRSDCLDRSHVWLHSVATATAARILAKNYPGVDAEIAYMAGLLHEVGLVILDKYYHAAMCDAIHLAGLRQCTIDVVLRERLGIDQFKAGAYLTKHWGLPSVLTGAIAMHNIPPLSDLEAMTIAIVHVASLVADACKMHYDPFSAKRPLANNAVQLLQITPAKIKSLAEAMNEERHNIEEFAIMCNS